jgi:NAD(P)H-hydrate epimerase
MEVRIVPQPRFLSRDQVRELDQRAMDEFEMPGLLLMENAGRGCAELLRQINPARELTVIVCGPGNNGGDGFVIARHLDNAGWPIAVVSFPPVEREPGDAATNWNILLESDVPFEEFTPEDFSWASSEFLGQLKPEHWVIDALFGTGLTRPLASPFDLLIQGINESGAKVLAVDLPSGLDCDTGQPQGACIKARNTATFVAPKLGFQQDESRNWTGEVSVIDIGAPRRLIEQYH